MTSDGCHLCREAEPVVRRVAERLSVALRVVEMASDDALVREFAWRIPVVLDPEGVVLAEGPIDPGGLRRSVRRARRSRRKG